jgi:hypothetical protein
LSLRALAGAGSAVCAASGSVVMATRAAANKVTSLGRKGLSAGAEESSIGTLLRVTNQVEVRRTPSVRCLGGAGYSWVSLFIYTPLNSKA